MMMVEAKIIKYGDANEQFFEWYAESSTTSPKGLIVLVHGGFWRQAHKLEQMHPLAAYFLQHGYAVANIEYRRADCGGAWPVIIQDVKQAFTQIRQYAAQQGIKTPLTGIGHSVGGQLVLLAAELQDLVVALAPVTDVKRTHEEGLGENAAQAFFGEITEGVNQQASPIHQDSLASTILVIHGIEDQRVPLAHSDDFVQTRKAKNEKVEYWKIEDLDHFFIINPQCEIWPRFLAYMDK